MKKNFGVVGIVALIMAFSGCHTTKGDLVKEESVQAASMKDQPAARALKVDLYVMSQCPYGVQAENILIPLSEELSPRIDLELFFVGTEPQPGVPGSLHGETEVMADLLQICTGRHDQKNQFGLIMCMNEDLDAMPGNFDDCAAKLGMKTEMIKACADGDEGKILLLEHFRAADAREVMGSPTIFIDGVEYDGPGTPIGVIRAVCGAFKDDRPELCAEIPEPVKFKMTIITDKRCEDCAQYVEAAPKQLTKIFPGLEVTVLDWSDEAGKAAYKPLEGTPNRFLPAFLFEKKVQEDQAFAQLAPYMVDLGDNLLMAFEASFDPLAEICGNGVDDDGNGKVDCSDAACAPRLECAKEKKKSLELFVMSQCPYGAEAVLATKDVLAAFGNKIKFNVRFLAAEPFPGQFQSLHGPAEVAEDLRQICARKYYAKKYKYMDYLYCRAADYQSEDWEKCAVNGIRADVLKKCSEGEEGRRLLSADISYSEGLQINASPTFIANNKTMYNAITSADIQKGYCALNKGQKGCEKQLSGESSIPAGACGTN